MTYNFPFHYVYIYISALCNKQREL